MNTHAVATKIMEYLAELASNGNLPIDLTQLDLEPIKTILEEDDTVCGWSKQDVLEQAAYDEIHLTDEEAAEVLKLIMHKSDMSVGVSWDDISHFIHVFDMGREK